MPILSENIQKIKRTKLLHRYNLPFDGNSCAEIWFCPHEAVTIHFKRILFTCYLQYNKTFLTIDKQQFVEFDCQIFAAVFLHFAQKQGSAAGLALPCENHFSSGCSITRAIWMVRYSSSFCPERKFFSLWTYARILSAQAYARRVLEPHHIEQIAVLIAVAFSADDTPRVELQVRDKPVVIERFVIRIGSRIRRKRCGKPPAAGRSCRKYRGFRRRAVH